MTKEDYEKYKAMTPQERILYLNSGTITENLHKMIDISTFEKEEEER